jgi:alpha-L-rhamnosidase
MSSTLWRSVALLLGMAAVDVVHGAAAAAPPPLVPLNPYPKVHGGAASGGKVAASPDPMVDYKWDLASLPDPFAYQSFTTLPVQASAEPASAFAGTESLTSAGGAVKVHGAGLITLKFAQEAGAPTISLCISVVCVDFVEPPELTRSPGGRCAACWVQFDSADFGAASSGGGAKLDMTLSENRLPGEVHNLQPKAYNSTTGASGTTTTYRLEPNNQLYEGVRYVFINVTSAGSSAPWSISNVKRVCQVVPTNYDGSFHSSDDTLNRIWWTGAYTARVTMVGNGLHSTVRYDTIRYDTSHIIAALETPVAHPVALPPIHTHSLVDGAGKARKPSRSS